MAGSGSATARERLLAGVRQSEDELVGLTRALLAVPSENPPGDTRAIAEAAGGLLEGIAGVEVSRHAADPAIVNLVARLSGGGPGRRLVFNGHFDTYPIGDPNLWSVDPLAGERRDDRLYGRGVADMKGGIACSILALKRLAECREAWSGEVVLTLAGDEETMGELGTRHLLEKVPAAVGDAMICGDAGSPRVLRFGEKGFVWVDVHAEGRAAHGAHVHLGISAIDRLTAAMQALAALRDLRIESPDAVGRAIEDARAVSEKVSGAGEGDVLKAVTVNFGRIEGGSSPNLVADRALVRTDIRLPAGASVADMEGRIERILAPLPGISFEIFRRVEPNWSDPDAEILRLTAANAKAALGEAPVVNMRVGASDSRLYRQWGIPSVVCGLTPHNMGNVDEYVLLPDLMAVAEIHAMTAFDFLCRHQTVES